MRVVEPTSSLVTFWQHLVFTEAALLAHPETVALAGPFTILLDAFQALFAQDLGTQRAIIQAQARAVVADMNVDDGLRELHSDTLGAVRQDRDDPIFKALFSSHIGATVRFALARQLDVAKKIVDALGLSIVPAALRPHAAKLSGLIAAGQEILAGRQKAAFARTESNLAVIAWKEDVNAVRLTTYGALLGIAAKTKRPKSWAEAFYIQTSDARTIAAGDDDTTAAATAQDEPTTP